MAALCPPESAAWGEAPPRGRWMECRLPDGTRHGKYTTWDLKGRVLEDGSFQRGHKHGHWAAHHTNGRPASEGSYEGGQKVGLWTSWAKNGTVRERAWYEAGRVVKLENPGAGTRPAPGSPASQPASQPARP